MLTVQTTRGIEFIDITDAVQEIVEDSGVLHGFVIVYSRHTTAAIRLNEHEPLLLRDMERMLRRLVPTDGCYLHDDWTVRTVNLTDRERVNGHAHCQHLLLSTSETVPVVDGSLALGRWQRLFLVELDQATEREVLVQVWGHTGDSKINPGWNRSH